VRIDFDRYGKSMIPFFEQVGVIAPDDDFWEEYATDIPPRNVVSLKKHFNLFLFLQKNNVSLRRK